MTGRESLFSSRRWWRDRDRLDGKCATCGTDCKTYPDCQAVIAKRGPK